jgi:DNA-3-methyladenine glycosylase II
MTLDKENFDEIKRYLINRDQKLSDLFTTFELRERSQKFSDFQNLIRIIVGQQLSGAAARTIFSRLISFVGNNFTAIEILKLNEEKFTKIGVSRAKAIYCQGIAKTFEKDPNYFNEINKLNDQEKLIELTKLKGVGIWTASIFVMSSDIFSDVFAYGDATLNKIIKNVYGIEDDCFERELEHVLSKWSPYKTLVCNVIWHYNDNVLTQTRNRI